MRRAHTTVDGDADDAGHRPERFKRSSAAPRVQEVATKPCSPAEREHARGDGMTIVGCRRRVVFSVSTVDGYGAQKSRRPEEFAGSEVLVIRIDSCAAGGCIPFSAAPEVMLPPLTDPRKQLHMPPR